MTKLSGFRQDGQAPPVGPSSVQVYEDPLAVSKEEELYAIVFPDDEHGNPRAVDPDEEIMLGHYVRVKK